MKVGYAVLYKDGELVISNNNYVFQKKIFINYGEFEDTEVPWKKEYDKIKTIKILNQVKSNNMKNWFKNCVKLTNLIDFNNLDVSNCKDFSYMCYNCQELIDISSLKNWDVSNGENFSKSFVYCEKIITFSALENWNMSNASNISYMFTSSSFRNTSILLSWNVSNVKSFSCMFADCKNLIDISALINWDVSNGEYFDGMFSNCDNLNNITSISYWNISNGKNFSRMFEDCYSLITCTISNWNFSGKNKYAFGFMFKNAKNLKEIYLSESLSILKADMFKKCNPKLKIHWKNTIYTYEDLLEYREF